jgi:DNA-binding MurR/RpiR family transcriptional regulator
MTESSTIAERIRARLSELPGAERRVARYVLSADPLQMLEPVATLASDAHASSPTVLRLLERLGFEGYADFQRAVKAELSARLSSPVELYPSEPAEVGLAERMLEGLGRSVHAARAQLAGGEFSEAVRLLADERRRVLILGGRFSGTLAGYLLAHLQLLRPGVAGVPAAPADRAATLLDVDRRHVVVAFDYRRYQHDTIAFGVGAKRGRASLVLFTDHHHSPLAGYADVVLATAVTAASPFDVLTPAVALVETLIACLVDRLGEDPRRRIARYDRLHAEMGGAVGDSAAAQEGDPG